ncbi:MAG: hypothetical protein ABF289_20485 [Clostridiales bacterium]
MEIIPINTKYGDLKGRDCIFLDKIDYDYSKNSVKLIGTIEDD